MLERLKKNKAVQKFVKTDFAQAFLKSQGDWRYPFLCLRWWLAKRLVPRRKVKMGDVSLNLSCENWITHFRWFLFKTKEKEVYNFIDNYLKNGDVFFDIGANVGIFSLYAAKKNKANKVFSFEPEYSNLSILKENIIHNGLMNQIKPNSVAISDFSGLTNLHIQDVTPGAAVHTESKENIDTTEEGYNVVWKEGIVSMSLEDICSQLKIIPNVIKIDTDGHEDKVLKGAEKILADDRLHSIVIEMPLEEDKMNICKDILLKNGFKSMWEDYKNTRNEIWSKEDI